MSSDRRPPAATTWHPPDLNAVTGSSAAMAATAAADEARRAAWMDGHSAAMAERDAEMGGAIEACQAAVQAMHDTSAQLRGQVSATVNALAVAIARHLLERELSLDPTHVQQLVTRALAIAPMSGAVTVRLHPADLASLQALGALPVPPGPGIDLRWAPDESVTQGGCVVEGPAAIVDGRIDRALLDIYEQISHHE